MTSSYVVTGGGQGVGRAIAEHLAGTGHAVAVLDLEEDALAWTRDRTRGPVVGVTGSAADEAACERAAAAAAGLGEFSGWVNNAAVFRDGDLATDPPAETLARIQANLAPAVVGSAVAVRLLLAAGAGGAIVNVSSHQAQRAVRGSLSYVTAKAAIEGLTRALAVDYGPHGIRTNAVALGSIETDRYESLLSSLDAEARAEVQREMGRIHPLGRIGGRDEVAAAVAFLLSEESGFVNGAVLPVDGGRAAWGPDPEER